MYKYREVKGNFLFLGMFFQGIVPGRLQGTRQAERLPPPGRGAATERDLDRLTEFDHLLDGAPRGVVPAWNSCRYSLLEGFEDSDKFG